MKRRLGTLAAAVATGGLLAVGAAVVPAMAGTEGRTAAEGRTAEDAEAAAGLLDGALINGPLLSNLLDVTIIGNNQEQ